MRISWIIALHVRRCTLMGKQSSRRYDASTGRRMQSVLRITFGKRHFKVNVKITRETKTTFPRTKQFPIELITHRIVPQRTDSLIAIRRQAFPAFRQIITTNHHAFIFSNARCAIASHRKLFDIENAVCNKNRPATNSIDTSDCGSGNSSKNSHMVRPIIQHRFPKRPKRPKRSTAQRSNNNNKSKQNRTRKKGKEKKSQRPKLHLQFHSNTIDLTRRWRRPLESDWWRIASQRVASHTVERYVLLRFQCQSVIYVSVYLANARVHWRESNALQTMRRWGTKCVVGSPWMRSPLSSSVFKQTHTT